MFSNMLLLLLSWQVFGDVVDLEEEAWDTVLHKRLLNHTFNRTRGVDPQHCLVDCFKQNDLCQSFNFDANRDVCELNNASHETHPEQYVDAQFFVYFKNMLFGEETPPFERHTFELPEPSPCDSLPCENGGLCTLNEDLGFLCVNCSPGFYGKMCEMRVDPCWPVNPCGAFECHVHPVHFNASCACPEFYEGDLCAIDVLEHRFDVSNVYDDVEVSRIITNSTTLTEMTLCFWYTTTDAEAHFFSYVPDDVNKTERILVWKNAANLYVKLGTNHEEVFENYQEVLESGGSSSAYLCIVLDTVAETLQVYISGVLRSGTRGYTRGGFQLSPGKLEIGRYVDPLSEEEKSFTGKLSLLELWSVASNESVSFTATACSTGTSSDNRIWAWDRDELRHPSLNGWFLPWSSTTPVPCTTRPDSFENGFTATIASCPDLKPIRALSSQVVSSSWYTVAFWVSINKPFQFFTLELLNSGMTQLLEIFVDDVGGVRLTIPGGYAVMYFYHNVIFSNFEWHHFALTCDGSTVTLYVDGKFMSSTGYTASTISGIYYLEVEASSFLTASFSNMNVWSTALPATYIFAIATGTGIDSGNLVQWKNIEYTGSPSELCYNKTNTTYENPDTSTISSVLHFTEPESLDVTIPATTDDGSGFTLCLWYTLPRNDIDYVVIFNSKFKIIAKSGAGERMRVYAKSQHESYVMTTYENEALHTWRQLCVITAASPCHMYHIIDGVGKDGACGSGRYFDYPHQFGPKWTLNQDQIAGLRFAHVNIWSHTAMVTASAAPAAAQLATGVMANHGDVLSWPEVIQLVQSTQSSHSITIGDFPELVVPDPSTKTKMVAYCAEHNDNTPCAKTYPGSGISNDEGYGLYCCCAGEIVSGILRLPVSSDCDKIPRNANITSTP